MRKLSSADFNDLPEDMSYDDVEVILSSRYRLIMRPLNLAMINKLGAGGQEEAINGIRFSIRDAPETHELEFEFEDVELAGKKYRCATYESIERLNPKFVLALSGVVQKISYLSQGSADKTDFTRAGDGTETQTPTVSE